MTSVGSNFFEAGQLGPGV